MSPIVGGGAGGTRGKAAVGVNLVPKGVTNTTVIFSSEGARNQRAPSEDDTFFHYC
jgi:hypothetical protein